MYRASEELRFLGGGQLEVEEMLPESNCDADSASIYCPLAHTPFHTASLTRWSIA
jgi:hypothetical protein